MKNKVVFFLMLLAFAVTLSLPVLADSGTYVADPDGYLTAEQLASLNRMAESVTAEHSCGVYICIVDDMELYGGTDIASFAEQTFDELGCGVGEERTGILLVLSMAERDYDLDAHGTAAHYAFTDYGKEYLAQSFLDNFREDDWYGGFADYITACGEMLTDAEAGEPVDEIGAVPGQFFYETGSRSFPQRFLNYLPRTAVLGIIVAFLYGRILKKKMRSVATAAEASAYVPDGGISLSRQRDFFTHTTVVRQHIERDGGSHGGTHVSSSGHSHSSGKF